MAMWFARRRQQCTSRRRIAMIILEVLAFAFARQRSPALVKDFLRCGAVKGKAPVGDQKLWEMQYRIWFSRAV